MNMKVHPQRGISMPSLRLVIVALILLVAVAAVFIR
jgi:hypothetical protein